MNCPGFPAFPRAFEVFSFIHQVGAYPELTRVARTEARIHIWFVDKSSKGRLKRKERVEGLKAGKTIRFGDLVRSSGRPQAVTLWVAPEHDRSFLKAVRENRVMTIHANPSSHKKEFGRIGFQQEKGAIYLVFPKSLPKDFNSRVVGINYQLAEDTAPKGSVVSRVPEARPALKEKAITARPPGPAKPKLKTFEVLLRRTATLEDMEQVKAATETEARQAAVKTIRRKRFDAARAIVKVEVAAVTEGK